MLASCDKVVNMNEEGLSMVGSTDRSYPTAIR